MEKMTRKEAIKRVKFLRNISMSENITEALDLAIAALESLEGGIRCKALKKKGTEYWYLFDSDMKWRLVDKPCAYPSNRDFKTMPPDSEFVDLIIVTPKE